MRRINMYFSETHWRQLIALGKPTGQKPSQLIRLAAAQYIARERRAKVVYQPGTNGLVRKHRGAVLLGD
jgi:hypothetical protein